MKLSVYIISLLFLNQACTTTSGGTVQSYMGREASLPSKTKITSKDKEFSAEVRAKLVDVKNYSNKNYIAQLNMGAEQPAECYLSYDGNLPASWMASVVNEYAKAGVKIISHEQPEIFVKRGLPVFRLNSFFQVDRKGQKMTGMLKQIAIVDGSRSVLCMHDSVGYKNSLLEVALDFAQTAQVSSVRNIKSTGRLIYIQSLAGKNIGVRLDERYPSNGKNVSHSVVTLESNLILRAKDTVISTDKSVYVEANAKGEIIAGEYIKYTGDKQDFNLMLQNMKKGTYSVSGNFKGKNLGKKVFKSPMALKDPISQHNQFDRILKNLGSKKTVAFYDYAPSIDPVGAVKVDYKKGGKDHLEGKLLNFPMKVYFGANKRIQRVDVQMGSQTMKAKIVIDESK